MALTDGWGVDVAVEAVGLAQTFQMATEIVRPGGRVANVGVHGTSVDLQLQNLWIHNIAITMGLVNSNTTPMLLKLVASGRLKVDNFATHHFQAARHDGRLRHVRPGRRDQGTEGHHRPWRPNNPERRRGS